MSALGQMGGDKALALCARALSDKNPDVDEVLAIGPAIMMKACVAVTKPRNVRDHRQPEPGHG